MTAPAQVTGGFETGGGTWRFPASQPLRLDSGAQLAPLEIAYKTYGRLNPTKTNVLSYDQVLSTRPARFKRMNVVSVDRDAAGKVTSLTISDLKPPLKFERVE